MEVEAYIGIYADTKVIVHHKYLRVVFIGNCSSVRCESFVITRLLLWMKYYRPPIQTDLFSFYNVSQ